MKLNEWLLKKDWKLADLAHSTKYSVAQLSRVASGTVPPGWPLMEMLVEITDGEVMPNDFLNLGRKNVPARVSEFRKDR